MTNSNLSIRLRFYSNQNFTAFCTQGGSAVVAIQIALKFIFIKKFGFVNNLFQGSMLLTIFFGKFYAGVKKLGRFTNEKYFFKFLKCTNFFTSA